MATFFEQIGGAIAKNVDIDGLADKIWDKIWAWAEPKLDETVDKYTPIIIEKLLAAMPVIVATAVQAALGKALEGDPDIPGLSNIFDLSETIRGTINADDSIPFNIPILSDILKGFGR